MLNFIKKHYYIFIIIISYTFILLSFKPFGIDDYQAMSYYNFPDLSIGEKITNIIHQFVYWNIRIGEIVFYLLGLFPRYIYIIVSNLILLIFLKLIIIITTGKLKSTTNHSKLMLSLYIVLLTLFPIFSKTFIWTAGIFNQTFSLVLTLLAFLPIRFLMNKENVFDNFKHKKLVYIIYYFICFFSGLATENIVPILLLAFVISIYFKLKQKEKINNWQIFGFILCLTSFCILVFNDSTKIRFETFNSFEWTNWSSKFNGFLKIICYLPLLIFLFFLKMIVKQKYKLTSLELNILNLLKKMLYFSSLCIIILFLAPYFPLRATILFGFMLMALICFYLNIIYNNLNIKSSLFVFIIMILTLSTSFFYVNHNLYNLSRIKYIEKQVNNNVKNIICPDYGRQRLKFFQYRLTSVDVLFCDKSYIKTYFNIDYEFDLTKKHMTKGELITFYE